MAVMSLKLTLVVLLGSLLLSGLASAQPELAQQAAQYYDNGDYAAASAVYEGLVAAGVQESAVFVNLGHSYFAQRDYGRALLNYRRAQLLSPRDNALSADLARVRSLRSDIQGDESAMIDSLALLSSAVVTMSELSWIVLGLWLMLCAALCVYVVKSTWRTLLRGPLLIAILLMVFGLILWGSRAYATRWRPAAVVLAPTVRIMSGPGEDYLELYSLHAAAELRILQVHEGWLRFILPDQRQGWLPQDAIERV